MDLLAERRRLARKALALDAAEAMRHPALADDEADALDDLQRAERLGLMTTRAAHDAVLALRDQLRLRDRTTRAA